MQTQVLRGIIPIHAMLSSLHNKHIVLGITGSIAAYKACTLVRLLIKAGAEVQVVMTPAAKEFITPLTRLWLASFSTAEMVRGIVT